MKKLFSLGFSLLALTLVPGSMAQMAGGPSALPDNVGAAMLKLFGKSDAFTADSTVTISDAQTGKETAVLPIKMAYLDGKMRSDIDLSQIKSAELPPGAAAQLKQMGMDTMFTIVRPDLKKTIMVYPKLKIALEVPLSDQEASAAETEVKIEKTPLGQETVGKFQCTKNKVIVTDAAGAKQELTVWNAKEPKDFPVRMEVIDDDSRVTIEYKEIKMAKPDAARFDVPQEVTKYSNAQEFQRGLMQKMMGQGTP